MTAADASGCGFGNRELVDREAHSWRGWAQQIFCSTEPGARHPPKCRPPEVSLAIAAFVVTLTLGCEDTTQAIRLNVAVCTEEPIFGIPDPNHIYIPYF